MQRLSSRLRYLQILPGPPIRKMTSFATIAQQIKLDILSKTHVEDNAAKRKEISRTFICGSRSTQITIFFTLNMYSGHNNRFL
jgi:hypothetical protein